MKRCPAVFVLCLLFWATCLAGSEERTVTIQFPRADVRDILRFYEDLSEKPLYMALDVWALVTIDTGPRLPRSAALELIRKTLLEQYGIELRTTDKGETLASWSKDPKYPKRSDAPLTEKDRRAFPSAVSPATEP